MPQRHARLRDLQLPHRGCVLSPASSQHESVIPCLPRRAAHTLALSRPARQAACIVSVCSCGWNSGSTRQPLRVLVFAIPSLDLNRAESNDFEVLIERIMVVSYCLQTNVPQKPELDYSGTD
jgi:hypothetical protein